MDAAGYAQFFTVLLIFLLVVGLTYLVTKWLASWQKVKTAGSNISVIETYRISQSQYVQILKIGEKYVCLAVSKDSTEKLCELDANEITIPENESPSIGLSFKDIFKNAAGLVGGSDKN